MLPLRLREVSAASHKQARRQLEEALHLYTSVRRWLECLRRAGFDLFYLVGPVTGFSGELKIHFIAADKSSTTTAAPSWIG